MFRWDKNLEDKFHIYFEVLNTPINRSDKNLSQNMLGKDNYKFYI